MCIPNYIALRIFPSSQKSPANLSRVFPYHSHHHGGLRPPACTKMPGLTASSPIVIPSGRTPISISDDSSPARNPDAFSHTPHWTQITDRSVYLGSPGRGSGFPSQNTIASRVPSLLPTRGSYPASHSHSILPTHSTVPSRSIPTYDQNIERELMELRELCDTLQTENADLQGKFNGLQYVFIHSSHRYY